MGVTSPKRTASAILKKFTFVSSVYAIAAMVLVCSRVLGDNSQT